MALIQCPNCGAQISDKAPTCLHCGYAPNPIEQKTEPDEKQSVCTECGTVLEADAKLCPQCGCPVPAEIEVTSSQPKSKKQFWKTTIAVSLVIIVLFIGFVQTKRGTTKTLEEYSDNFTLATAAMLSGASDAESCGNLIKKVWYNAIFEKFDDETNKYTLTQFYSFNDFNEALNNLFSDSSFKSKINTIKDNQSTVQTLMSSLQDPPESYQDAYAALSNMYVAYANFIDLVINPTGNLQTFSSSFSSADSEVSSCYNALSLYLTD